jgi:hypothetical protein
MDVVWLKGECLVDDEIFEEAWFKLQVDLSILLVSELLKYVKAVESQVNLELHLFL